jgi:serine/threonine-protein phosphatase 6 regulatory ankyrin repeat subunit B
MYNPAKKNPALIVAAYDGCKDVVEQLIASGTSVHVVDDEGHTPLHVASLKGHRDVVEFLIAHEAQIDARTEDGCTPLYLAAFSKHREIAQLLLNYGATMEPDIALMLGDIELVKYYLDQGVDANSKLARGLTKGHSWLNTAIGYQYKNRNIIELLLNHGALVNEKTGTFKFAPLHRASITGSLDICSLLITHDADVNAEDAHGNTPLHWAARLGHQDIVEFLLDSSANVNALNHARCSALFHAAQFHRLQVVECLLSRGAEVNLTDEQGFTPLMIAFHKSRGDDIVRLLVTHGADVNVRFPDGTRSSPLRIAMGRKNKDLVELLLAHGAREDLE